MQDLVKMCFESALDLLLLAALSDRILADLYEVQDTSIEKDNTRAGHVHLGMENLRPENHPHGMQSRTLEDPLDNLCLCLANSSFD